MNCKIVVTDSGPIIHLAEVGAQFVWGVFSEVWLPAVVEEEVTRYRRPGFDTIDDKRFKRESNRKGVLRVAGILKVSHSLGMNDAEVLAQAIISKADILLTDDLELRETSKREGITPVGTIGILLRAFRERLCGKEQLFEILDRICRDSSLYITKDIIQTVKRAAAKAYRK